MNTLVGLMAGISIGILLAYVWFTKNKPTKHSTIANTIVLEKIEKVFKIVIAEGFYSDIYDYKNEQHIFFDLFKSSKKALLIANARVLVGYDFAKVHLTIDNAKKIISIIAFPAPEILAIDTEYQFYDTESGLFNRFADADYTAMMNDAKSKIGDKALQSELPKIAAKQMKALLSNFHEHTGWQLFFHAENQVPLLIEYAELPHEITVSKKPPVH